MTTDSADAALPASIHALHGETMGTRWSVQLVASPRADLHVFHNGVQHQMDLVVAQMSNWEPDSDLSRFNRAPTGIWQSLPAEFFSVLSCALDTARESGGVFDPTLGPLVAAWGFGPSQGSRAIPPSPALDAARARVGWLALSLRAADRSAMKSGPIELDLSAIAKGYAVDLVARHLRDINVHAALIEVGGELYGYGRKPGGGAWQVLVETSPDDDLSDPCVLTLDGIAVATSGDHWHAFEHDGRSYSHTIDPRTGAPVIQAPAAVTVAAADAMHADAWATALTVMGASAGFDFAQCRGLAVRFVSHDSHGPIVTMTDAFRALVAP